MQITFDLDQQDLRFFRRELGRAARAMSGAEEAHILEAARAVLDEVTGGETPAFIRRRIATLTPVIDMLEDPHWPLPRNIRRKTLAALAYFGDPDDLIPDNQSALGFLDDAFMIELLIFELRHHIDAWLDLRAWLAAQDDADNLDARRERRAARLIERAGRRRARRTGATVLW